MITRIYVDNYKSLVNFELDLTELTFLIGRNGVGKTSVLDVIYSIRQLLSGTVKVPDRGSESVVFDTSTLTRWQDRDIQTIEIDACLEGRQFRYRLEIEHQRLSRRARIAVEKLDLSGHPLFRFVGGEVTLYRDNHSIGPTFGGDWSESALARVPSRSDNTYLTQFVEYIRKVVVVGINPTAFAGESFSEDMTLHRDAKNFAAWYRHLLLERQELIPEFIASIRDVMPGFQNIRMEKIGVETRVLTVMFEQFGERYELRLNELSDGQRVAIALYTLVKLAAGQGYTLFLDEPENYLALEEIQPWLMILRDACGGAIPQAVLCSHHPELIDYLGDRATILKREASGVTTAQRLESRETGAESGEVLRLSEQVARGWLS